MKLIHFHELLFTGLKPAYCSCNEFRTCFI